METTEAMNTGVTVRGDGTPESYIMAPRTENPPPNPIPTANPNPNPNPYPDHYPTQIGGSSVGQSPATEGSVVKKKRGRPRKYGPDGSPATALSPMPISSISLSGEFSAWKRGEGIACTIGAHFTPHVLTVNAGEDVNMKVMSFCQQGSRAICILSANGTISNVTLRLATSSGGTLSYEGCFEILSLSGSYMLTEDGGTKSRSGGMSVSLAGPDGRVVGGGLAGTLVAAGPVQVVLGSFLPGHQQKHKHKKQRIKPTPPAPPAVTVITAEDLKAGYAGVKPVPVPDSSFHGDNLGSLNPLQAYRDPATDSTSSSEDRRSNGDISC